MSSDERRLIRRLQDRDERAFRELVAAHRDRVFNLTYRMLGNRAEAEDVAQEVFISVFKTIDGFRGDAKLSTWLYRVAANHCKNRIKYLARRSEKSTGAYDDERGANPAGGAEDAMPVPIRRPDHAAEAAELEVVVQAAIAELDEDHRLLVILRDVEDLDYDEIGTITGLPEGTVKSRLHRARAALKKKLERHLAEPAVPPSSKVKP